MVGFIKDGKVLKGGAGGEWVKTTKRLPLGQVQAGKAGWEGLFEKGRVVDGHDSLIRL